MCSIGVYRRKDLIYFTGVSGLLNGAKVYDWFAEEILEVVS